ncbi:hypothetical protein WJX77_008048 [Trebouxia sp. C0004]
MSAFAHTLCAVSPISSRSTVICRSIHACKVSLPQSSLFTARQQSSTSKRSSYTSYTCKAGKDSKEPPWQRQEGVSGGSPIESDNKKVEPELSPQDKKGQRTAIITGFISVAFGVAYLLLVSLLDSRGNVLHPPPPEAFGL